VPVHLLTYLHRITSVLGDWPVIYAWLFIINVMWILYLLYGIVEFQPGFDDADDDEDERMCFNVA